MSYYVALFGSVEERLDLEPDWSGETPIHTKAIEFAESCEPPPDRVLWINERTTLSGAVQHVRDEVFAFHRELNPAGPRPPIPLNVAVDNFMRIAFPNGQPEVTWKGPKGINNAMSDLLSAWLRERRIPLEPIKRV